MSRFRSRFVVMTVAASILLAACGSASPSSSGPASSGASTAPSTPAQPVAVRVAMTPFFDYQFFAVAKELGWDKELGVDLQFTWLTQSGPSVEALANGSVDTVNTCVICNFPFYESVPELTDFLTVNQFKGFVLIGRKGASKTYDEFLAELKDPVAAQKAALEQVRGKTFPMYSANYETLLKATLGQAGMTLDDVTITNFPDDEKAALAFLGGTGEFYMGGLPSEINILQNHADQAQLIGGAEILGPAGLWYSQVASSTDWLAANEETALRIMAMSYRYNRYVNEKRDAVMETVANAMNEHSGVATSVEDLSFIFDQFLAFRSYQDDKTTTYDPASPLYWGKSADYYVTQSTDLPAGADYRRQNPLDEWFAKFLERSDLLEWVDAPLS